MELLFTRFLSVSIGLAPLIGLLLLLLPLLGKRYAASLNSWIWLAVAARLLLPLQLEKPVVLELPLPQAQPSETARRLDAEPIWWAPAAPVERGASVSGEAAQPPSAQAKTLGEHTSPPPSPLWVAGAIWLAGAAVSLAVSLIGGQREKNRLKRWALPASPQQLAVYGAQRKALGIPRDIPLYLSAQADSPVLVGLLRPRIYLPEKPMSTEELRMVLLHELHHYLRRDLWRKLVILAAVSLHWFNPLVHMMARRADADLELACDGDVLRRSDFATRRHYGLVVLETMTAKGRRTAVSTRFCSGKRGVARRFRAIVKGGGEKRGIPLLCAVVLGVFLAGGLVACQPEIPQEPEASHPVYEQAGLLEGPEQEAENSGEDFQHQQDVPVAPRAPYESYVWETHSVGSSGWDVPVIEATYRFFQNIWSNFWYHEYNFDQNRLAMDERLETVAAVSRPEAPDQGGIWPVDWYGTARQWSFRYGDPTVFPGVFFYGDEEELFRERSVLAYQDGTVMYVVDTPDECYGRYVVLGHDGGVSTLYAMCAEILVAPGDTVAQGQAIARTGRSGVVDYFSLYFEKRVEGQVADSLDELAGGYGGTFVDTGVYPFDLESGELDATTYLPGTDDTRAFYSMYVVNPGTEELEASAGGSFIWPTVPGRATTYAGHAGNGVDIAPGGSGHPIYAVADGQVTRVVNGFSGYGHYIVVDHQNGYQTLYAHNSANYVSEGDNVAQGDVIGAIGSTGIITGNALHFEVRYSGRYMNPMDYIGTSSWE